MGFNLGQATGFNKVSKWAKKSGIIGLDDDYNSPKDIANNPMQLLQLAPLAYYGWPYLTGAGGTGAGTIGSASGGAMTGVGGYALNSLPAAGGVGGGIGGTLGSIGSYLSNPMGMMALTSLAGSGLNYLGAKEQIKALKEAGKFQEALQLEQMALARDMFEEGKTTRLAFQDAALSTLPQLKEDAMRKPGTGGFFDDAISKGTADIAANLSKYGLLDSSVMGRATGEFATGLMNQDMQNIVNNRFRLAGFAPDTTSSGISLLGQAGQTGANIGNLMGTIGEVKGGLYGSYADTLNQIPMMMQLQQMSDNRWRY